MENYPYNSSYPESGDSSPRSREIEFENPPPWEDSQGNQQLNYKVKFMCSYGGKIHPRPHDNQLSYVGGETKILSVDRNIKFGSLLAKLIGLCESENISFKYQLPGEDLDALISVTNDDDLEHMMHEYERLYRISPKPARLRIFIFPTLNQSLSSSTRSFGSVDEGRSEKERFVEALNSAPIMTTPPQSASPVAAQPQPATSNVDFLFGLEKSNVMMAAQPPAQRQVMGRVPDAEDPVFVSGSDERFAGLDPIQKHIQDLQGLQRLRLEEQQGLQRLRLEEQQGLHRLRLEEQEGIHRRKSEDNIPGGGYAGGGEYYKAGPEKAPQAVIHGGVPYWADKQVPGGVISASGVSNNEQAVYMMPAPANVYHSPMVRPMAGAPAQGFYTVQRLPSEMYRDQQQMYNMMQQQSAMPSMAAAPPPLQPQKAAGYSEGFAMVRPGTTGGVGVVTEAGYGQMAYDGGMGRQVIYTTPGGVMAAPPQVQAAAQYQAMAGGVNTDMRQGGALNQEAAGGFKGVQKVTQGSL